MTDLVRLSIRIDPALAARARSAYSVESGFSGARDTWSDWVAAAIKEKTLAVETAFNQGRPFPATPALRPGPIPAAQQGGAQ